MSTVELAARVLAKCQAQGLTLGTAESLTGGLVCAAFTDVPGSSAVVRGGVVSYATDIKASVLGVDAELLASRGAVDPEVARLMAEGAVRVLGVDMAVATTGVAGPDPQDGVEPGVVYLAVAGALSGHERHVFAGGRNDVRQASVLAALGLLDSLLGP
jgi:nicotinamide-nucleotide amidase